MKLRATLAGLLVVLLAVVVVLVSSGGGGNEAQSIKGSPFTGDAGVTRSVAAIRARQRYFDAHPEIERRRNRQLVAEEAAREAANESASGEEEEARAEEEASGEEQEAPAEAKTSGEEARSAGEPAISAEADATIREKPEPPGEGAMPPKRAAPGARLERVGSAAITPSQAVDPSLTNFLGAQASDSGFIPPDSMGAVGPSQVLVAVNGRVRVFDKQGNPGGLNVSDSAFWAPVRNGSEPTDPGVEYDRLSQRWIVSGINTEDSNNRIMLAVSDGPTITSAR